MFFNRYKISLVRVADSHERMTKAVVCEPPLVPLLVLDLPPALPGWTLFIRTGTYPENIPITKPLTLNRRWASGNWEEMIGLLPFVKHSVL